MSNNNNSGDWIIPAIVIVVGVIALLIWKFSQTVGLDFPTGAEVLKWLVLGAMIWIAIWFFSPDSFWHTWPIALATLWPGWWPALDYWSNQSHPVDLLRYGMAEPMWYAKWYTKWGVLVGIIVVGYGLIALIRRR